MRLLLPCLLLLAGCPDPSASRGAGAPKDAPPGGPGGPGGPGAGGSGGGSSGPVHPGQTSFKVEPGQGVKLSGTIAYAGTKTGTLRLDILRNPGTPGTFPELLYSATLDKAGPWEVEAPKNTGAVGIVAYLDADGNGPSQGEPAAEVAAEVKDAPLPALDLTLSDSAELGAFKPPTALAGGQGGPGTPPPGGEAAKGAPPPGSAEAAKGPPPPGAPGAAPPVTPPPGGAEAAKGAPPTP